MVVGTVALAALEPLARAMDQLTAAIKEGYQFTGKAEKAITALGTSFEGGLKQMGPAVGKLRGTIEQQFTIGVMQLDAGLRGNTTAVAKLINQQMLTGTAYKQTAEQFGRLQTIGGLQVGSLNNLADRTREVGATYGISTDKLVKALDVLKEQMVFFDVAGMSEGMTGAMVSLKGMLGATFDDARLSRMMKVIAGTGTKFLKEITFAGIGDVRDRIAQVGNDADATLTVLMDAIMKGGANLLKQTGKNWLGFGAIMDKLDPGAKDLIAAFRKLSSGVKTNADVNMEFADTIRNMWDEVWNPIKRMVLQFQPEINKFAMSFSGFIQVITDSMANWIIKVTPAGDVFDTFLQSLLRTSESITIWATDTFLTLKNYTQHIILPVIVSVIKGMITMAVAMKQWVKDAKGGFEKIGVGAAALAAAAILTKFFPVTAAASWGLTAIKAIQAGGLIAGGIGVAQIVSGKDEDQVTKIMADKIKGALGDLGANWTDLETAQAKNAGILGELSKKMGTVRDGILNNVGAIRQQGNSLFNIQKSTASIDNKTTDPRSFGKTYLHLTEEFLSRSMSTILGLSIRDDNDLMVRLVNLTEEQTAVLEARGTGLPPIGGSPLKAK